VATHIDEFVVSIVVASEIDNGVVGGLAKQTLRSPVPKQASGAASTPASS
jgi:hypothetical protein